MEDEAAGVEKPHCGFGASLVGAGDCANKFDGFEAAGAGDSAAGAALSGEKKFDSDALGWNRFDDAAGVVAGAAGAAELKNDVFGCSG